MELIKVEHVSKHFKQPGGDMHLVLEDVNLTLHEGEVVAIVGKSGSGKSSLLRIIAGLIPPDSGRVLYRGREVHEPQDGIAMVFQTFALFPWLTVLDNVELGLEARGLPKEERVNRALAMIDLIGLDGFESAYPKELSGGMRQRVGIARALAVHPDVLLMDEPFRGLDVLTTESLRDDILDLWLKKKIPTKGILVVSHDIQEAVLLANRVVVLSGSPGTIQDEVVVDLPYPRNRESDRFKAIVEEVYDAMTKREKAAPAATDVGYRLPNAPVGELLGLLDTVASEPFNGRADLPVLADEMGLDVDDLFPLLEALQIFGLAKVEKGDIELTEKGWELTKADILRKKELFAEILKQKVPLAVHIQDVLRARPNNRAPEERFLEELEGWLSEDEAKRVLRTVVEWGRYGELFAYDESSGLLSLENPEPEKAQDTGE